MRHAFLRWKAFKRNRRLRLQREAQADAQFHDSKLPLFWRLWTRETFLARKERAAARAFALRAKGGFALRLLHRLTPRVSSSSAGAVG